MGRYGAFLALWGVPGVAYAMDVQDAPVPDPNCVGILAFVLLFVGGGVWFKRKFMPQRGRDKRDNGKHAEQ